MELRPLNTWNIGEGGHYWASWGSKGWTAVLVISVARKWAKVRRLDPKTGTLKKRTSKVRLDELVKRDPKKKGKDKPKVGPADVFAGVRSSRKLAEEAKAAEPEPPIGATELTPTHSGHSHNFETPEEAEAFMRKTWDKAFGDGSWDSQPDCDW
jgi:hypothetical protein